MTDTHYDLIIIGAGPGGYVAAIRAAQLGLKTACVESRETLGGTCLNVGCIPSKALLHASELYEEAHSGALAKFGVDFKSVSLNLDQMQAEKTKAVGELTGGIEFLFKKNKVDWLKGHAAFTGANALDVAGKAYTADKIMIATGSSVTPLPGVDHRPEGDRRFHRRAGTAQSSQAPGRHRRRGDRAGTGQRLAAAWEPSDGGRISRSNPARHGRRGPQRSGEDFQETRL